MTQIISIHEIAPNIFEMILHAPGVAAKAKAGQFCIVMADEKSERIPLTLADWNPQNGTVTLVIMAVGTSTHKLVDLKPGDSIFALAGPLGQPSHLGEERSILFVAGGVGAAPVHPIAKEALRAGKQVTIIHGARSRDFLFWEQKMGEVCNEYIVVTDDGSHARKALVTQPLNELLSTTVHSQPIEVVYAIGPAGMMRACAETTRPFGVKTIVSLNTIMIDGTGMCGGCRVNVAGKTKFACVDGPEFDAHQVEWATLLSRQKGYAHEEKCSLDAYLSGVSK